MYFLRQNRRDNVFCISFVIELIRINDRDIELSIYTQSEKAGKGKEAIELLI